MNRILGTVAAGCVWLGLAAGANAQLELNGFGAYPTPNNVPAPYAAYAPATNYGIASGYRYQMNRPYTAVPGGYSSGGYSSYYGAPGYGTMGYGAAGYSAVPYRTSTYGYSTYSYPTYRARRGIFGWRNRAW